jgi:hydroxyacylglutathione hydrolase
MTLVGREAHQGSGLGVDRLAARLGAHTSLEDEQERVLLDLVVAELLAGLQSDQHRARRLVLRVEHERRAAAARSLEFAEIPVPHGGGSYSGLPETAPLDSAAMSLAVDRYELGPIGTNCYVVRASEGAPEAVVVDPGADAARLRLELARLGARCVAILITHGHWDHLGGVADLAEGTAAPVHMAAGERIALEQINDFTPPDVRLRPYTPDVLLEGDETLELAGISFETLRVPGHSPAHLAFSAQGCLFSGDVLFAGSVGRTDLPFADWDTLVDSIRTLAERFPAETVVYPGHGSETTLGVELARNPFLAELRAS